MKTEDMILVSIDDHVIEPPDMFERHVPAKYRDRAPKIVQDAATGIDQWEWCGVKTGSVGLNAVASWPNKEWGFDPIGFAEMRPGVYDIHERVRDMNANGVLASMCFPTFAGFNGMSLARAGIEDHELSNAIVGAYNDWHIDEWCGTYPGRFLPLAIGPMWDVDACVKEIHRCGKKGFRALSLPETPYGVGLPSFADPHWEPIFKALCDEDMAICLHIGGAFGLLQRPADTNMDSLIILSPQLSAVAASDLMVGGVFLRFPDLKVALSEGGIGWVPFFLDRMDRHMTNHAWTGLKISPEGLTPTELWRKNFLGCFITDPAALNIRDRMGIETVAWECDFPHSDSTWPHSPELLKGELDEAGCSDADIHAITWENASRFFHFDPFEHRSKEQATVGALRALAGDVDTRETSRSEYKARYLSRT